MNVRGRCAPDVIGQLANALESSPGPTELIWNGCTQFTEVFVGKNKSVIFILAALQ